MASLQWETVRQNEGGTGRIRRVNVPGGWLVVHAVGNDPGTILFVPDATHEWDVDIEPEGALPTGRGWDKR